MEKSPEHTKLLDELSSANLNEISWEELGKIIAHTWTYFENKEIRKQPDWQDTGAKVLKIIYQSYIDWFKANINRKSAQSKIAIAERLDRVLEMLRLYSEVHYKSPLAQFFPIEFILNQTDNTSSLLEKNQKALEELNAITNESFERIIEVGGEYSKEFYDVSNRSKEIMGKLCSNWIENGKSSGEESNTETIKSNFSECNDLVFENIAKLIELNSNFTLIFLKNLNHSVEGMNSFSSLSIENLKYLSHTILHFACFEKNF